MARPLRIEYEGALYHVMSRGNGRGAIFRDEPDRQRFLATLEQACTRTGWQVHAWVLMGNHFHLVLETPEPNLVKGMKWFLGTYTQRFNLRHRRPGHLFQGRYKAQVIDERSPGYLRVACDYVHLNPVRARLVPPGERLESYRWSSYGDYLRRGKERPAWLRVDRLLGEYGATADNAGARRRFSLAMEARCAEERTGNRFASAAALGAGWRLGAEDFLEHLLERAKEPRESRRAAGAARRELESERAQRLLREELQRHRVNLRDLPQRPKGDWLKVRLATLLRRQTTLTLREIARQLSMGSPGYVANLLTQAHEGEE
jgi:REP element-mobilizing transposase RayT